MSPPHNNCQWNEEGSDEEEESVSDRLFKQIQDLRCSVDELRSAFNQLRASVVPGVVSDGSAGGSPGVRQYNVSSQGANSGGGAGRDYSKRPHSDDRKDDGSPANKVGLSANGAGVSAGSQAPTPHSGVPSGVGSVWRHDPYTAGYSVVVGAVGKVRHDVAGSGGPNLCSAGVQDDVEVDGSGVIDATEHSSPRPGAGGHQLADLAKGGQGATVSPGPLHGGGGTLDSGNRSVYTTTESKSGPVQSVNAVDIEQTAGVLRCGSLVPLDKKGGGDGRHAARGSRPGADGRHHAPGETQAGGDNAAVCGRGQVCGACPRNAADDDALVKEFTSYLRHTITCTRRRTRLPTEGEMDLPLHVKKVSPIDLDAVRGMMSESRRARFDEVWRLFLESGVQPPSGRAYHRRADHDDACRMVDAGVAQRVGQAEAKARPTTAYVSTFSVVEEKDEDSRRRLISWTKAHNDALAQVYTADVPLLHVSKYLDAVFDEVAGKRDLSCGFYQIEIPKWARAGFRFMDSKGNLYEMVKAPMGHTAVPELMHTIVATIAGVHGYSEVVQSVRRNDVFIDGLRVSGKSDDVTKACKAIDARAQAVGATFKEEDSYIGSHYDFNGALYDHVDKTVCVRRRTIQKVVIPEVLTLEVVEALVGRLIHASAILDVPIVEYYMTLKAIRRRLSQWNRGEASAADDCNLPPKARHLLEEWVGRVRRNLPVTPTRADPFRAAATIFTDASGDGWGAVYVSTVGQVHVVGGRWQGKAPEINHGELLAVKYALLAFANLLGKSADIDLRVDNTSVLAAMNRKKADAERLATEMVGILAELKKNEWRIRASYIHTSRNPADSVSRPNKRTGVQAKG